MKASDFDTLDTDIHLRIFGALTKASCPSYSREPEAARAAVECINNSGQFKVCMSRVVGQAHRADDWQCEIFTADGIDNLATAYDPNEALAVCRAITHANLRFDV